MSSRKFTRSTTLAVVLSIGALSIPCAEASQPRSRQETSRATIQKGLDVRSLQSIFELWRLVFTAKDQFPPGPPGPNDTTREGSGLCPNGQPRGLSPSNGGY
jgi:hypothetical protein